MSNTEKAALKRALILSVVLTMSTAGTEYLQGETLDRVIAMALVSFGAAFVARFGGEGLYDAKRDREDRVNNGDVGYVDIEDLSPEDWGKLRVK